MDCVGSLFKTHYQLVNKVIQPLLKPNMCRICLNHSTDLFIDVCGHTICTSCSEMMTNDFGTVCPYCKKPFTKDNLKKIFF